MKYSESGRVMSCETLRCWSVNAKLSGDNRNAEKPSRDIVLWRGPGCGWVGGLSAGGLGIGAGVVVTREMLDLADSGEAVTGGGVVADCAGGTVGEAGWDGGFGNDGGVEDAGRTSNED
jgi:hypothetical protein